MATNAISEAQLEANRNNAQRSTGPTSPEGKSVSSRNAVKHGFSGRVILNDPEERVAYAEKAKSLIASWKPMDEQEEQLVELIHDSNWQIKRIRTAQEQNPSNAERLDRYLARHTGVYFRAVATLIRLQTIRRKADLVHVQNTLENTHAIVYNPRKHGVLVPTNGFVLQECPAYQYFDRLAAESKPENLN